MEMGSPRIDGRAVRGKGGLSPAYVRALPHSLLLCLCLCLPIVGSTLPVCGLSRSIPALGLCSTGSTWQHLGTTVLHCTYQKKVTNYQIQFNP
ncbi:hypothetical protein BP00DRAFT_125313 [Aspergillus indologenus CBS 114.80]|uniref:Uncharacterized protein n=1 Tax=Aspergillus indologenus CBS 114.80 TaxID=1450541 RepID=A0A2V5IGD9_9EURO|nr:hypothetical protein BP00DRAFT_125313 [Aspergillus indologenus CBS 114.80]